MAERQGFEPWIPCGIHAFQACAFSHSAISPLRGSNISEGITSWASLHRWLCQDALIIAFIKGNNVGGTEPLLGGLPGRARHLRQPILIG